MKIAIKELQKSIYIPKLMLPALKAKLAKGNCCASLPKAIKMYINKIESVEAAIGILKNGVNTTKPLPA